MKHILPSPAIIVPLFAILTIGCLLPLGCGKDTDENKPQVNVPPYGTPEHYGYLLKTQTARNPYLIKELDRIEEEEALPEDLTDTQTYGSDGGGAKFMVPELSRLFTKTDRDRVLREAENLYPKEKDFKFDSPDHLQRMLKFLDYHNTTREAARKIADRDDFRLHANLLQGMFAELAFVDVVWICAYLEAYQAAESLYVRNDPEKALEAAAYMLRWATFLGNEPHLITRLEAAYLRTEAMHVIIAALHSNNASADTFQNAYTIVMKHINLWPDEQKIWRGERAVGMHTYEVARNSDLGSLLEPKEYTELAETVGAENLDLYIYSNINTDELFYLNAMRRIIDAAALPFHERKYLFATIEDELNQPTIEKEDQQGKKRDRTVLADKLLLPGIEQSQKIIAEDQANWEALARVIAEILHLPNKPKFETNPLTGKLYQVVPLDDSVAAYNIVPLDQNRSTSIKIPIPKSIRPAIDEEKTTPPETETVPRPDIPAVPQPGVPR